MGDADDLVFSTSPEVEFGSNTFVNVPIILRYNETPLIEVTQVESAGFSTRFSIFGPDGVALAKVVGSRLFLTDAGKKADLKLKYPPLMTVCELGGKTLFEVRRKEAAALSTAAELFTPDGRFIKGRNDGVPAGLFRVDGTALQVGGLVMTGCRFENAAIGIQISGPR
jgi:hypothetical protein